MRLFHSGNQFDVDGAILKALSGLKVDLAVDSSVELDECQFKCPKNYIRSALDHTTDPTELSFNQSNVPATVCAHSPFAEGEADVDSFRRTKRRCI